MSVTLKVARIIKGYTQTEAANLLSISPKTLLNYEKGKTFPPQPIIVRIENLYGISYDNIIFLPKDNG